MIGSLSSGFGFGGGFSSGGGFSGGGGSGGGRYALGGIVTQPTKAVIAESGYAETILPMTSGYLSELARLIGKYSGNNSKPTTNNIYLDSRLIQRQIASREEELEYAKNG